KLRIAAIALAIILLLVVMGQNWGTVTTRILMMEFTMPQALLSLFNFLLGIAVGVLVAFLRPWRKAKD
ncbi:MAG: hypothetical protein GWO24_31360, partial [Akkermansiaceae bacterium]|nr:hypothetical protein [Akkermansiaceae bacterium]